MKSYWKSSEFKNLENWESLMKNFTPWFMGKQETVQESDEECKILALTSFSSIFQVFTAVGRKIPASCDFDQVIFRHQSEF